MNNQMPSVEDLVAKLSKTKSKELKQIFDAYKDQPIILQELLAEILDEIIDKENPYKYPIVTPEKFLNDNYFFGKLTQTMYPKLKEDFINIHDNDMLREIVLTGSIGWGKTFFIALCLAYEIYKLSCLKDPQLTLKISKSSKIVIMNISITEKQAKEALFSEVKNMITESDYFKDEFMFDSKKKTDELIFPNNIWFQHGTSTQSSTIGLNIYSAALDEANFFRIIKQSKKSIDASGEFDQALTLYYSLLRRQESRFLKDGVRPGKLYLGSSKQYPNDFTEKRIKAASESATRSTYVMDYSRWAVNREAYQKEEFQVEIGGMNRRSRILEGNEHDITGDVISVPMDFHESFKKDIENAIRDIAGMSLYSINPFIGDKEFIKKMFRHDLPRVFSVDRATLSPKLEFTTTEKILSHEIPNPKAPRYVHLDIGLKHDRFGFVMGHIERMITVEKTEENEFEPNKTVKVKLPKVKVDMILQIYPEKEFGEVELSRVRDLMFKLISYGYKIKYVSADGFQSADMKQILQRRGIEFDYISMDRTTEPYETMRSAIYDGRVECPYHDKLEEELHTLEKNYVLNKVDHSPRGSKDIADALGGMTYNAHIKMKYYEDPLLIVPIENTFTGSSQIESYDQTVENFEKWVKEGDLHSNEKKRYSKNVREISGGSKEIHPPPENNNGS